MQNVCCPISAGLAHSDSQSAIARLQHTGPGPGQQVALEVSRILWQAPRQSQYTGLTWVKGHAGISGNEKADVLARSAASHSAWSCRCRYVTLSSECPKATIRPRTHGTPSLRTEAPRKSLAGSDEELCRPGSQLYRKGGRSDSDGPLAVHWIRYRANDLC